MGKGKVGRRYRGGGRVGDVTFDSSNVVKAQYIEL